MKKLLVIMLCLVMVLGLAACGGEKAPTALEMYNAAGKLAAEAKSMSADFDIKLNLSSDAIELDMPMVGDVEIIMNEGTLETVEYKMDMNTEMLGMTAHNINYLKDGVAYIYGESEGEVSEYKYAADADYAGSVSQFTDYQEYSEDMVIEQSVANGVAALTLDGEAVKEYAMNLVGVSVEDLLGEGNDFSIDNMVINFTVDEAGQFKDITMNYAMNMLVDGSPVSMTIDAAMTYTGYNNIEAIDYPDFSNYEDLSEYF